MPRPAAILVRLLLAAPFVVWGGQLAGLHYSADVAMLEHAVLEQVLVLGWMLDEARGTPAVLVGLLAAAVAVGAALLNPGPSRAATRPLAALALIVPVGALFVLGAAMEPVTALLLLLLAAATPRRLREPQRALATLPVLGGLGLLFVANLLATSREGTWYDRAAELPLLVTLLPVAVLAFFGLRGRQSVAPLLGGALLGLYQGLAAGLQAGLGWGLIGVAALAGIDRLRHAGAPSGPDPLRPSSWAPGLLVPSVVCAACLLGNAAVEVRACPDADHPAVRLVDPTPAPFDLAWSDGQLAVVHRERGWMRLYEGGTQVHEVLPVEGDLEEVFPLPDGFLLTEILDDEPFTLLRVVDRGAETVEHRLPGMCWVSSMAWDAGSVLLGCETQADLLRFHLDGRLEPVARLPVEDDLEDLHLRTDERRVYAVSLAEGDQLWALSPDDGRVLGQRDLGGLNYSVVHDPGSDRVLVARFHDAQVVAFDRNLERVGSTRVGFGVRPLESLPGHSLVLAASMFDGRLRAVDPEGPQVTRSLRLGGRVKALAVDPEESRAWVGSSCGVFEVDLRRWLGG